MNAGMAVRTTQQGTHADSLVREIRLEQIAESKTNPRSHFDEKALAELAASVRQHGVLQPVIVRPHPGGARDGFELVVGSRRFRASKLARRETIPASVRELSNSQVTDGLGAAIFERGGNAALLREAFSERSLLVSWL